MAYLWLMMCCVQHFQVIEKVRQDLAISLTYFEFSTLATLWIFQQAKPDVVILEVGMGGRLDAVNAFEPDCSLITSIDLDHQEFLGHTREAIAYEKAGILRSHRPSICLDANPPLSLMQYAASIDSHLACLHRDFFAQAIDDTLWCYHDESVRWELPLSRFKG